MDIVRKLKSKSSGEEYTLWFTFQGKFQKCSCPHWQHRIRRVGSPCKHHQQLKDHDEAQLFMQAAIMAHFEKNWVLDFYSDFASVKPDEDDEEDVPALQGAASF